MSPPTPSHLASRRNSLQIRNWRAKGRLREAMRWVCCRPPTSQTLLSRLVGRLPPESCCGRRRASNARHQRRAPTKAPVVQTKQKTLVQSKLPPVAEESLTHGRICPQPYIVCRRARMFSRPVPRSLDPGFGACGICYIIAAALVARPAAERAAPSAGCICHPGGRARPRTRRHALTSAHDEGSSTRKGLATGSCENSMLL
jgi:hypothetical protein